MSDSTQHGPTPERLDSAAGAPLDDDSGARGRGARRGLVLGGGVAVLALGAGAAWAWTAFFGQGAQPAQALPADTLAYLSVDLDPSGQQKIEAIETLRKFPAFSDELGLDTDDDLRRELFESAQEDGICPELDYATDVEPWLGNRAAIALVPGGDAPQPVFVLQVRDGDAAADGLAALVGCADEEGEAAGYALAGDWVVVADTEEVATAVAEDADDAALDADADFRELLDAAGDPGFVTMYVAPEAGQALADAVRRDAFGFGDPGVAEDMRARLEEFPGLGGTVRFAEGDVELEVATGELGEDLVGLVDSDRGDDTVVTLPANTAVAVGAGFDDGWLGDYLDQLRPVIEQDSGLSLEEMVAQLEAATGLTIPEDVEALLGDSFALALGPDVALENLFAEGPAGLPLALKVEGDPAVIERVVETIRRQLPVGAGELLLSQTEGDHVVIGPNQAWLAEVAGDGGLGDTDAYDRVVAGTGDAAGVVFVNFDAEDWLVGLAETSGETDVAANLAPLDAFGISTWLDDGRSRVVARLTTED